MSGFDSFKVDEEFPAEGQLRGPIGILSGEGVSCF